MSTTESFLQRRMTETTPPETETKELRKLSFSQYQIWANCPHDWKLRYHDKLRPKESSIELVFGRAVHETVQAWLDVHYNKSKTAADVWDMKDYFKDQMRQQFLQDVREENGVKIFPCDQATFVEYYLDGLEILEHVKRYRDKFFPTEKHELVGCEIPLERRLNDHLTFIGYIDIVVRNTETGRVTIFDLKTSKKGWFDYQKKDPKKINQVLLYKRFYSEVFEVDEEFISVQFVILKRKIQENSQWEQIRLSKFEPADGTRAVKTAVNSFKEFTRTTFGPDGQVQVENLKPNPSASACKFCPFKAKKDLCPVGVE